MALASLALALAPAVFHTPFVLQANSKPIDVEIGHAAPCYGDYDMDGKKELLVGQFADGTIRIYKNYGTNKKPIFKDFTWLQAGGKRAEVAYG